MRHRAKNTHETTRTIVNVVCGTTKNPALSMALPKVSNLSRTIRRTRNRTRNAPTTPRSLDQLVIEGDYMMTNKKDNFLLFDSGPAVHRMMIFGTNANLEFLANCEEWYMDGTFDICPPLFQQVYTIHGECSICS